MLFPHAKFGMGVLLKKKETIMSQEVKILRRCAWSIGHKAVSFKKGETREVPDAIATSMIKNGYADVATQQEKPKKAEPKKEKNVDSKKIKNKAVQSVDQNKETETEK